MDKERTWYSEYQTELTNGVNARARGNEGMARVCARRAAGLVVREYLIRNKIPARSQSVLVRLRMIRDDPGQPDRIRKTAGHFLSNITPDHVLPDNIDLLKEVKWLYQQLLGDV